MVKSLDASCYEKEVVWNCFVYPIPQLTPGKFLLSVSGGGLENPAEWRNLHSSFRRRVDILKAIVTAGGNVGPAAAVPLLREYFECKLSVV